MRRIKVQESIRGFDGEPIVQGGAPVTVKMLLTHYLGMYNSQGDGESMVMARALGQKIYDHKIGAFEVEESEFKLIEKAIAQPQHTALLYAPLFEAIKNAEKVDLNKKGGNKK